MPKTQTRGWQLTITHPGTGKTVSPDVLENPEFAPSLNSLVEARIPVRRSEDVLEWPSGTTVDLTYNGDSQPVDELEDIEQEADRTIIVAEGGIELEERLKTEFREERRHVAAEKIIDEETPYTADVDTPDFELLEDQTLQTIPANEDFNESVVESDAQINVSPSEIETYQSAWVREAELESGNTTTNVSYSGGSAAEFEDSASDPISFTFTTEYEISNPKIIVRGERGDEEDSLILLNLVFDDETLLSDANIAPTNLEWDSFDLLDLSSTYEDGLPSGEHTVRIEVSTVSGNRRQIFDLFGLIDETSTGPVSAFDNQVHEDNGFLDDPPLHPNQANVTFSDAVTPFVIEEATATVDIDDTSNKQALALSSDRGASFTTSPNTDSISISNVETPQVRVRVTLSNYSPQGPREETPRLGYASQTISNTEIETDLRLESLLIDEAFDDSIRNVLNDIAGDEYLWSYRIDDGTPTVAWTQPGQRESNQDPDIEANVRVNKNLKTWNAVTIKGSSQSVSGEVFSGSTAFQELDEQNIVPGSESVTDRNDDDTYRRGEDYEMRYNDGEVRRLSQGSMGFADFEIDYRYEVEGTFPEDYSGNRELVETIPGVVSERQARQLAYIILEVDPAVSLPSFSADVLLPRSESVFDPLEALSLDRLGLPDDATPLEIREEPQQTPDGTALRLGARDPLASLSRLSNKLQKVSRRS